MKHLVSLNHSQLFHFIENSLHTETINDADAVDDYKSMANILVKQKAVLVCFRNESDEIVGLSMNYVLQKGETFFEDLTKVVNN